MQILPTIELDDLCLYFKKQKLLVLSDLHIGYEEALNKQGILVPRFQFPETVKRLEAVLKHRIVKTIIITGDLKHEFGTISETEWRQTLKILDLMSQYAEKIILLKGNHDTILEPITKKRNLVIEEYYLHDGYLFIHGDNLPKQYGLSVTDFKAIIMGHEHPAVGLREKNRVEVYKCFLKGTYKKKPLIVLPSFNLIVEGTDILKERLLSPLLKGTIDTFEVYIVSDTIYPFGTVKELKRLR